MKNRVIILCAVVAAFLFGLGVGHEWGVEDGRARTANVLLNGHLEENPFTRQTNENIREFLQSKYGR